MSFTHTHVHSYYSLMDGLNSPKELLEAAKAKGQDALAITDHGNLSAHREFLKDAKDLGMKPILGLEAYISPTDRFDRRPVKKRDDHTQNYHHIILLAKGQEGYETLGKLSQLAWEEGFYSKPRIDIELLEENSEGLIVLSGCMNGLIAKAHENERPGEGRIWARRLHKTFGDDFYMEVQPHNPPELNAYLLDLADELGIAPVATGDCHYAYEEDRANEEAMLILSTGPNVNKKVSYDEARKIPNLLDRFDAIYPDRQISFRDIDVFVTGEDQIKDAFIAQGVYRDDIIENTRLIRDKVGEYQYWSGVDLLPRPDVDDPQALLEERVFAGMKKKGLDTKEEYVSRAKEELGIIADKGYASYLLVQADTITWAKGTGIMVGPGRGSAAGSLCCYSLGITAVDPIKHGLLFFRFIDPGRDDNPDVDTDFEDRRRGEVKDRVLQKYGHVASIATFNKFQGKNSVRDAARVFRVPLGDVNKALKGADYPAGSDFFNLWLSTENGKAFRQKFPEAVTLAKFLHGRIRGQGMHAGGIVVSKEPIVKYAPIQTLTDPTNKSGPRIPLVASDMKQVADIGLIKMDFLGLKLLSVISDALRLIEERKGIRIDLEAMDEDDQSVFADISSGYTKGMFQVEAFAYTKLILRMGGVADFGELAASNALVRPGAADSSAGARFIARKKGLEPVTYHHELTRPFTEDTYGTIIYQEQLMLTATELAGMDMSTANALRTIVGKKHNVSEFESFKEEFIEGARQNVPVGIAEGLWHDFEAHANYSFNKSHAVAYSKVTYWTAWLKKYYPLEYTVAMLSNEKDKDMRLEYLVDAKRREIEILLPHVNESGIDFGIQEKDGREVLRFGLSNIKWVSANVANKLIGYRPYKKYSDLTEKVYEKGTGLSTRHLASLDAIGASALPGKAVSQQEVRDNLYEYLAIPSFETKDLSPVIKAQITPLDEYDEQGGLVVMGMVRKIKRGEGWARVEIVDEVGSAGIFASDNTTIETGQMYVFLVGNNRIMRWASVEDLTNDKGGDFQEFLEQMTLPDVPEGMYRVVAFQTRTTKAGKKMAHAILADEQKNLTPAMVFPQLFMKAYSTMKPGATVDVQIARTEDNSIFVGNIL